MPPLHYALDIACMLLVLCGLVFFLGAAVGLLRFPDFYTRMHAAGKGDTLSTLLIMTGVAIYELHGIAEGSGSAVSIPLIIIKIMAIGIFIMVTSPTSTHALMHAGYDDNISPVGEDGEALIEMPPLRTAGDPSATPPTATATARGAGTQPQAPAAARQEPTTRKTTRKKITSKKVAQKKSPAKRPTAKKVAAKKVAAKKVAAKKTPAKKVASKKVATKKVAAKKATTARKTIVKKTARKKVATRRPPVRGED
jgi:multicomponent Na+:H+ antiporter subunit G